MKNNFRVFKTGFIFGLVLISIFAFFTPNASAGIIKVKPLITVTYPTTEKNIIPNSGVLTIPLSTIFTITGVGASIVTTESLLKDSAVSVELKVESKEDWIDASIDNSLVPIKLSGDVPKISILKLTVTGKAPAFQLGSVRISATSKELQGLLFTIAPDVAYFDVSFAVGFWPVINYDLPKGNLLEVGPTGTADFEIELENIGNGVTYIAINPIDIPKGDWSVNIASSVTLDSPVLPGTENTKSTVHLIVKPPYGFGFHNERQTFRVQFTPYALGVTPPLIGQVETITFTVQNVGMSPGAGFEIPLIVIILIVFLILIYLYRHRKK